MRALLKRAFEMQHKALIGCIRPLFTVEWCDWPGHDEQIALAKFHKDPKIGGWERYARRFTADLEDRLLQESVQDGYNRRKWQNYTRQCKRAKTPRELADLGLWLENELDVRVRKTDFVWKLWREQLRECNSFSRVCFLMEKLALDGIDFMNQPVVPLDWKRRTALRAKEVQRQRAETLEIDQDLAVADEDASSTDEVDKEEECVESDTDEGEDDKDYDEMGKENQAHVVQKKQKKFVWSAQEGARRSTQAGSSRKRPAKDRDDGLAAKATKRRNFVEKHYRSLTCPLVACPSQLPPAAEAEKCMVLYEQVCDLSNAWVQHIGATVHRDLGLT
eukprot:gene9449-11192_t